MHESTRRCLLTLKQKGKVPLSAFGRPAIREMQPLLDGGVLGVIRSGAGRALQVNNAKALQNFIQIHFPEKPTSKERPARAQALRTMRNTKQAKSTEASVLLLRALRPILCTINDAPFDIFELTRKCGTVGILLDGERRLLMNGNIALVENQECFLHAERMNLNVDAVIYTAGRLSGIALQFLAGTSMQGCTYLHCPDYDPVGLNEYLRYHKHLHKRIRLHIPDNLRELLFQYGKPTLLEGRNSQIMQTLRRESHADISEILQWMDEANAGLEQEILIQ